MGVPSVVERENLRGRGAKIEYVPVPVLECVVSIFVACLHVLTYLSGLCSPVSRISSIRSKY